uniref:Uncharacterized protein n=1 Tax=Romanomermis culicivorax TaxID=13658 RepID=A0A915IEZ1_ROMCU
MTKKPINQPTLSSHMPLEANYAMPPVEAIALATYEEIKQVQATNPASYEYHFLHLHVVPHG